MIEKTMSPHDYIFDEQIIRRKGGGSIGLDLTGVVADIYTNLLRERNILPKRYKDDINLVLKIPAYDKPQRTMRDRIEYAREYSDDSQRNPSKYSRHRRHTE